MPIETTGSASGAEIPEGTQLEFVVKNGTFGPEGMYGPEIALTLNVVDEEYYGAQMKYWARIQQPRLDLVRKWRKDGMSDKLIAEALRERGFKFKKVDDKDKMNIGRGGNLYRILTAGTGSPQAADELLAEVDSFEELAERMVGFHFVATTKNNKNGYPALDGNEEIFVPAKVTVSASADSTNEDPGATDSDEDFQEIPF